MAGTLVKETDIRGDRRRLGTEIAGRVRMLLLKGM